MSDQDIRWEQRYKHFKQAFSQLEKAVFLAQQRPLSELEEQGLIQAFEYTYKVGLKNIATTNAVDVAGQIVLAIAIADPDPLAGHGVADAVAGGPGNCGSRAWTPAPSSCTNR